MGEFRHNGKLYKFEGDKCRDRYFPYFANADYQTYLYKCHLEYLYNEFILPWKLRQDHSHSLGSEEQYLEAVIVDTHITFHLCRVIANLLFLCPLGTRVRLFTSVENMKKVDKILGIWAEHVDLHFLNINAADFTVEDYNRLLTEAAFWEHCAVENVLVFQADSLMMRPFRQEDEFFRYGYIGAPWSGGKINEYLLPLFDDKKQRIDSKKAAVRLGSKHLQFRCGNGGFSLRRLSLIKRICSEERRGSYEPEDMFFSRNLQNYSDPIPSFDVANSFAVETLPHPDPLGAHCSWLYLDACDQANLFAKHLRTVAGLSWQ